jgi:hypothetical protein
MDEEEERGYSAAYYLHLHSLRPESKFINQRKIKGKKNGS